MSLRVLHVLDHSLPHHSGYVFRTLGIVRAQRAMGWQTFHVTSPKHGGNGASETIDGWHFFRTRCAAQGSTVTELVSMMRALTRRLRQLVDYLQPDVLQVHSPVINALPALWVSHETGVPLVYEVRAFWEDAAADHGTTHEGSVRYRLTRWLETLALRRAHHVTTLCEGLARDIRARGVSDDRLTVIPNAVDLNSFTPRAAPDEHLRAQLGLTGKIVLGFIGSFYSYEGLDVLIDALANIRAIRPNVAVLLVGAGPMDATLREQARTRHPHGAVVFAGRVEHAEVARYYDLIDVLVYPRHRMRLTDLVTPIKPLEAMAQGRLVMASNVGGHRELIRHGDTGWLFPADSAGALAQQVLEFLDHPEHWPGLRDRARQFVAKERTWEASVARYRPVFASLVPHLA